MTDEVVIRYIRGQTKDPTRYPYSFLTKGTSEKTGQRMLRDFRK